MTRQFRFDNAIYGANFRNRTLAQYRRPQLGARQFPAPGDRALVDRKPFFAFDEAAQSVVDGGLWKAGRNFKQRAEHHHIGGTDAAQAVGNLRERQRKKRSAGKGST